LHHALRLSSVAFHFLLVSIQHVFRACLVSS
jgi:hypothetical protein